jgi:macrophage erythroblast attacher
MKRNLKSVQRHIERERDELLASIPKLAKSVSNAAPGDQASVANDGLKTTLNRLQGLKRKLDTLNSEEKMLHKQSRARIEHLNDLYGIPSLADVKYDIWSQQRLDRLMTDYLLRMGYLDSAQKLAKEKHIEDLVDSREFVQCHQIEASLKKGRTQEALNWCGENRQALKKLNLNADSPADKSAVCLFGLE